MADATENETPVENTETPAEQPPAAEAPPTDNEAQAPVEQAPAEQAPEEQAPKEQAPEEQALQEQTPQEQAPQEQAPQEQAPQEQAPEVQPPAEQAPVEQAPEEQPPKEQPPEEQPPEEQAAPDKGSVEAPIEQVPAETGDTEIQPEKSTDVEPQEGEIQAVTSTISKDKSKESLQKKVSSVRIGKDSSKRMSAVLDRKLTKSRMDRLAAKAKNAVGSSISIHRLSTTGDFHDRLKGARYMNSYKLDSDIPFNPDKVKKILENIMIEALENLTYDPDKCPKQAKWASNAIRTKVKELQFDRYKLICLVTIGEKNSQDVYVTCRFLWDVDRDRYAYYCLENTYVFGIAQCFGVYYE